MANIITAKHNSSAMFTSGPMAFAMADITTCKPETEKNEIGITTSPSLFFSVVPKMPYKFYLFNVLSHT